MRVLRVFHHWCSPRKVGLFFSEQVAALALFGVGAWLAGTRQALHGSLPMLGFVALASALFFQASLYFADLYDLREANLDRTSGLKLLRAMGVAVLGCAALSLLVTKAGLGGPLLFGVAGAALGLVATRAALPRIVGAPDRVLVLGGGPRARELLRALEPAAEVQVVATVSPRRPSESEPASELDLLAAELRANTLVVAVEEEERGALPAEALVRCRLRGIEVLEAASFAERVLRRLPVALLDPRTLVYGRPLSGGRIDEGLKRIFDVFAASLLATLAAPLMAVAAVLVRLDSRGPIFYQQERVGRGGRTFVLTKFRTMRVDAESDGTPVWAQAGDARVTRVGRVLRKTRMDELPQVFAVLSGHMSFVGPRPERPFFVDQIKQKVPFFGLREAVKPGITGWAQIRYPYGASIEDACAKLEFDLYYIRNRSVFLDLTIIFHTVRHVLCGRGAR